MEMRPAHQVLDSWAGYRRRPRAKRRAQSCRRTNLTSLQPSPPVVQRLREERRTDAFDPSEVRDRPSQLEHAVIGPSVVPHLFRFRPDQCSDDVGFLTERSCGQVFVLHPRHLDVDVDAAHHRATDSNLISADYSL